MFNGKTLSEQEKEGSQKKETNGGGDSQEKATSEFNKVLIVEKTSKQDEPAEEVKSLAPLTPLGWWWSWWRWSVGWLLKRWKYCIFTINKDGSSKLMCFS